MACHTPNQIHTLDYLELKGFWNMFTYSQEKWSVRHDTNFKTHCILFCDLRASCSIMICPCVAYFISEMCDIIPLFTEIENKLTRNTPIGTSISPITVQSTKFATSVEDKLKSQEPYKNCGQLKNISNIAINFYIMLILYK